MALYYRLFYPELAVRNLDDIEKYIPFMYLDSHTHESVPVPVPVPVVDIRPGVVRLIPDASVGMREGQSPDTSRLVVPPTQIYPKQSDSLFWCIYIAKYGYMAYNEIGHRYSNTEIEEKQRMIELMRATPNKIKDCPKRITKAQFQEIMSDFMTNKKVTSNMLVAFAIYCKMRFWIVQLSADSEANIRFYTDISSNESMEAEPVIICRTDGSQRNVHGALPLPHSYGCVRTPSSHISSYGIIPDDEGEQYKSFVLKINQAFKFDNYDTALKPISNYKITDLEIISEKLGICREKKCKKQDMYDKILQVCT
jgi:hypothetical protein